MPLERNTVLAFDGISCHIEEVMGQGSNAIVYGGWYPDSLNPELRHHVLVKELFPFHPQKKIIRAADGHIAIALMDERSEFTTSAHFVLLTGINKNGRYEVNDPFKPNYSEDYLAEGFAKGFTEEAILAGLEGCWVFRKDQMGSFRYTIEMPQLPKTRYGDYQPCGSDSEYLARFVWVAARNEPQETQQAVAEMVLNRIASDQFPYLVEQVTRQEDLYVWHKQMDLAQPDVAQYQAVTDAIYGPHVLPTDVYYGAPWIKGTVDTQWGKLGSFNSLYEN
jgi:hypothetical protein